MHVSLEQIVDREVRRWEANLERFQRECLLPPLRGKPLGAEDPKPVPQDGHMASEMPSFRDIVSDGDRQSGPGA